MDAGGSVPGDEASCLSQSCSVFRQKSEFQEISGYFCPTGRVESDEPNWVESGDCERQHTQLLQNFTAKELEPSRVESDELEEATPANMAAGSVSVTECVLRK